MFLFWSDSLSEFFRNSNLPYSFFKRFFSSLSNLSKDSASSPFSDMNITGLSFISDMQSL